MTLDIKKWKTILNVTDNTDILEHIKAKLKEQDESVYQEWEQSNFNLSYLFSVSIGDKVNGVTLLHIAARCGHLNVVKHLIEKGARVNEKDILESTPLHMAAAGSHLNVAKYLIEKGARVNEKDILESTPLHMAAAGSHLNAAKYLIEKGAKINGSTPLHMAVLKPNSELNEVDTQQKVSQQRN